MLVLPTGTGCVATPRAAARGATTTQNPPRPCHSPRSPFPAPGGLWSLGLWLAPRTVLALAQGPVWADPGALGGTG